MTDTPHSTPKSHAELIANYSSSQYKVWLDMAAKEAIDLTENRGFGQETDFSSSEEGHAVTEYSASAQKFL